MIIGGLDLGTSGCKLTVYDDDRPVAETRGAYPVLRAGGRHSVDAIAVWEAVKGLFREAVAGDHRVADLAAVSVSSFGEAASPVDRSGRVLGDALLFSDNSGCEEMDAIEAKLGADRIRRLCGVSPHPMYTVCRMAWHKKHSDFFPRAAHFLLFEDFIIYRLTGERAISYSLASRTMALDVENRRWAEEIFEAAGLDVGMMSRLMPSGTPVATIRSEVAAELGINRGMTVVTGGHDQMCQAVGGGALEPGVAANGSGTVEALSVTLPADCDRAALCAGNYSCSVHADPNLLFTYAFCSSGSVLLKWYVDTYNLGDIGEFSAAVERMRPERPTGMLVLPYFTGTGTPYLDANATGHFSGLTLETTREEVYLGIVEGLTYDLALNIRRLSGLGVAIDSIRASGGGSTSPLWLQTKADVIGIPVHTLKNREASAMGCIMMAATAMGQYDSLSQAASVLNGVDTVYVPDEIRHTRYGEKVTEFERLYLASRRTPPREA